MKASATSMFLPDTLTPDWLPADQYKLRPVSPTGFLVVLGVVSHVFKCGSLPLKILGRLPGHARSVEPFVFNK